MIPEYGWFTEIPPDSHLKTKTQLAGLGKKPGGPVCAQVVWRRRRRIINIYDLFDEREAVTKRQPTDAQKAALEKAHKALRTCKRCGQEQPKRLRDGYCQPCLVAVAKEAERAELTRLAAVARSWLDDETAVILDTETHALHGYVVQIAVMDMCGTVLLNTRVNPQVPITAGAHAIHHLSDTDVADAPTYPQIHEQITQLLRGRHVLAYNAAYDHGVLFSEVLRYEQSKHPSDEPPYPDPAYEVTSSWVKQMRWSCIMELYAAWYGDWSDRHHDYRYQRLGGDHDAVGDCLAALSLLRQMVDGTAPTLRDVSE